MEDIELMNNDDEHEGIDESHMSGNVRRKNTSKMEIDNEYGKHIDMMANELDLSDLDLSVRVQ